MAEEDIEKPAAWTDTEGNKKEILSNVNQMTLMVKRGIARMESALAKDNPPTWEVKALADEIVSDARTLWTCAGRYDQIMRERLEGERIIDFSTDLNIPLFHLEEFIKKERRQQKKYIKQLEKERR